MLTQALVNFASAVLIAIISSWIGVWLSVRRFRREKWWEKKADAYSKALEALHASKTFAYHHLKARESGRAVPQDTDTTIRQRARAAHDEILRAMNVGAFLLCEKALARLRQYQKDADAASEHQSWDEYLEADWAAADGCLKELIDIAKKDLRTK